MIKSMTAFGRAKAEGEDKDITIEIKSVNSRFFDCSVKIPRVYSFLEERIKAYVQKNAVSRAKVDVYVTIDNHSAVTGSVKLDAALAESYIAALCDLRDRFSLKDDISVMAVAQNREIFTVIKPEEDMEKDWLIIKPVLDNAIDMFIAQREREGEKLKADLLIKKANLMEMADRIEKMSAACIESYAENLKTV